MLASGLPERNSIHAKSIALVALDMLVIGQEVTVDDHPVKVTVHRSFSNSFTLTAVTLINCTFINKLYFHKFFKPLYLGTN